MNWSPQTNFFVKIQMDYPKIWLIFRLANLQLTQKYG